MEIEVVLGERTSKMTRAREVAPGVMLAIWNLAKKRFSDEDLEEFASTMGRPYNEWARAELVLRRAVSSRN